MRETLGGGAATVAVSTLLAERLLLGPVAAAVAGRYVARSLAIWAGADDVSAGLISDSSTAIADAVLRASGVHRRGRWFSTRTISRAIAAVVAVLLVAVCWGAVTALVRAAPLPPLPAMPRSPAAALWLIVALGRAVFGVGSADALEQIAPELEPPRIRNLRRTALLVGVFSFAVTALGAIVVGAMVPNPVRGAWLDAPLAGMTAHVIGPPALRFALMMAIVAAAVVLLMAAVRHSLAGVHNVVARLIEERLLSPMLRAPHPHFGTPTRVIDLTALLQIAIVLVSAGQPGWLVSAYAVGLTWSATFKIAALIRYRSLRREPRAFLVPFNIAVSGRVADRAVADGDIDGRAIGRGWRCLTRARWPGRCSSWRSPRHCWSECAMRRRPTRRRRSTNFSCCPRRSTSSAWKHALATCWCPSASRTF